MGAGKQGMFGWCLNHGVSRLNLARHTFCEEESIKTNWSKNPCPFPLFAYFSHHHLVCTQKEAGKQRNQSPQRPP